SGDRSAEKRVGVSSSRPSPWGWLIRQDQEGADSNIETVGGCGFEAFDWKFVCCPYHREIRAPQPAVLSPPPPPSLIFPYSDSIFKPQTPSGLVACLDDHGAGAFPSASPLLIRQSVSPPPPPEVLAATPLPRYYEVPAISPTTQGPEARRYFIPPPSTADQQRLRGASYPSSLRTTAEDHHRHHLHMHPHPSQGGGHHYYDYYYSNEPPAGRPPSSAQRPAYLISRENHTNDHSTYHTQDTRSERFSSTPAFPIPLPEINPATSSPQSFFASSSRPQQEQQGGPNASYGNHPSSSLGYSPNLLSSKQTRGMVA
ncbi:hypothetical protein CSUI_011253, partial [Cystoisospora suis]